LFSHKSEEISDPASKKLLVRKENLLTSDYWLALFGALNLQYIKVYLKVKVFWISTDRDYQIGAKIKTPKNP